MKKTLLISLLLMFCFVISVAQTVNSTDKAKIERLLNESKSIKTTDNRILFFANKFIGTPYVAHTLEVNKEEQLIINTRQLDCTTFVETVVALALCSQNGQYTYSDYCNQLQKIRYRKGRVAYTERLHYFTDWIDDNAEMGFVRKIESNIKPFTAIQKLNINYMSNHVSAYTMLAAHPQWLPVIRKTEQILTGKQYRYIPKSEICNSTLLRNTIHDGDIIAILTNKSGLDTSHIGFAVWKSDGLHLLNASSIHKKVVLEPMLFGDYLKKHPSHIGIRVCRLATK